MESKVKKIYKKASKDLYKQFDDYLKDVGGIIKDLETNIKAMEAIGQDATRQKELLFLRKKELTLQSTRYSQMVERLTRQLAETNQISLAYINNQLPSIYTINYNQKPDGRGFRFDIVDESTIKRRIVEGDIQLPKKRINISKDVRWNTKYINSQVLQGILQGDDMQKIAKRIFPEIMAKSPKEGLSEKEMEGLIKRNKQSAIRNARTLVTGAENQGRLDRYGDLESKGLILNKVWIATPDERVREWHLSMDGQEVGIHEMFVDGLGNELSCPGDPNAEPETVWNCRCSMNSKIIGFRKGDRIIYV